MSSHAELLSPKSQNIKVNTQAYQHEGSSVGSCQSQNGSIEAFLHSQF